VCDKRRDIAVAETHFPGVDFSHIEPGQDLVYEQHRVESEHAVMERGARFLQWLMARCGAGRGAAPPQTPNPKPSNPEILKKPSRFTVARTAARGKQPRVGGCTPVLGAGRPPLL
jgi:hypothetical protein